MPRPPWCVWVGCVDPSVWARGRLAPREDGVADIIVGWARLKAEARGKLAFGEAAEFPERDHTHLLLDRLLLGEGDGLAGRIREHERAVFDLNVDMESELHGHSSHVMVSVF